MIREEDFRGGVHAALGIMLAVCAAWNAMKCCTAPRRRNLLNVCLYAPLVVYEMSQAKRHWSAP